MNKLLNVLQLCSLLLLAGGCRQDNFDGMRDAESSSDAIGFDIGFAPGTRVTTDADFESRWERGDAVGVFAFDAATAAAVFTNEKLTYDGTAWKSDGDLRWKGRSLKFYAYYPYDAGATDAGAIPFEVHSDQSSAAGKGYSLSDLMTAATGEQAAGSTVSLRFRHEMALLQVGIPSSDEGQAPGQTTAVRLTGVRTGATLNLTADGGPSVQTATGTGNVKMYLAGTPPPRLRLQPLYLPRPDSRADLKGRQRSVPYLQ